MTLCLKFKIIKNIKIKWKRIFKFIGALILSFIIAQVIYGIRHIYGIQTPISLLSIYVLNYLFNRKNKDEQTQEAEEKNVLAAIIGAIGFVGLVGFAMISSLQMGIYEAGLIEYETNGRRTYDTDFAVPGSASSAAPKGILSGIENILPIGNDAINVNIEETQPTQETEENAELNEQKESEIRNVFLESMCFIPELITSEGKAEINLKLSDNITTWTIQTVGNTLDGRVNYSKIDNVKVFKEFFVDFELPKNLIESDKVSIPVSVYNYTDSNILTTLRVKEDEWFKINGESIISVNLNPKESKMVYIPIEVIKFGDVKFRIEASGNELTDIVEKRTTILPNGYKIEKVISSGVLENDTTDDILLLDEVIPNTAKAKVKIYASNMAQTVEGMENILKMPSGCFEQISSSLYPDILTLKYLQDNGIVNEELKDKAIKYITTGYQKILTYEVPGEKGGYSLYGSSPAETVLTAYGLMELTDLKEVYNVDENVLKNMESFLYKKQNLDGSFTITGNHQGGASSYDTIALNAYITWALSESKSNNSKLENAINYLKNNLDKVNDNYTLALIANCLVNVKDNEANNVIKRLVNNINVNENNAVITSNIQDYYGSRYNSQNLQTTALTSLALSKASSNTRVNKLLINEIINKKDVLGTWYSTQATILCLKALNAMNEKSKLDNQTIKVKLNSEEKEIEIKDNALEIYEVTFDNLTKENKLYIDMEKGNSFYEVVEEYYIPHEKVNKSNEKIEIIVNANTELKVNEILNANIKLTNKNDDDLANGMVTIFIPQGFSVQEETLAKLKHNKIIEKYEMNYSQVNLYLRNFEANQTVSLDVSFRGLYPVSVTGLTVRAYDYYNPSVEGISMPIAIRVK